VNQVGGKKPLKYWFPTVPLELGTNRTSSFWKWCMVEIL